MALKTNEKDKKYPCVHWNECGGCPLITVPYAEQLIHKKNKILDAFSLHGFDARFVKSILKNTRPSPKSLGYRNKAKWILQKTDNDALNMGIYYPGTHQVVDIPQCSVHAPLINEVSLFVKQKLLERDVPIGPPLSSETSSLRYLIVRYSFLQKKLIFVFVSSGRNVPGLAQVVQDLTERYDDKVSSVVQNINEGASDVLLGEANRYLVKKSELTEKFGPFKVAVGPLAFLQINIDQALYIYSRVKTLLGAGPYSRGLDLYSGVGLFSMFLSSSTQEVVAIEENGAAAMEAMTACRRNKIGNVLQLCTDAAEGIRVFQNEFGKADWMIINPPRKGCETQVLEAIVERPPDRLFYISCNPHSLARDIRFLLERHPQIQIKTIEPVDMFPQTEHVECIVYLTFGGSSAATKKVSNNRSKRKKKSSGGSFH